MLVGYPVIIRTPSSTVRTSTPSRVPSDTVRRPSFFLFELGSVATSEISPRIFSSDQLLGNSLLPFLPVPARCPPPWFAPSPSRMCVSPFPSTKLGFSFGAAFDEPPPLELSCSVKIPLTLSLIPLIAPAKLCAKRSRSSCGASERPIVTPKPPMIRISASALLPVGSINRSGLLFPYKAGMR